MRNLVDWLGATPFSITLQATSWAIPSLQSLHILAIAAVLSSALMMNLRVLQNASTRLTHAEVRGRFGPWLWGGLIVLLATGFLLVVAEPNRSVLNPVFLAKMAMLVVAVGLTTSAQTRPDAPGRAPPALALATFGLWILIAVAGRWIAYVDYTLGS